MSWIVETLLRNIAFIKATEDTESDEFNNLIIVEKRLQELSDKNVFSSIELNIINALLRGDDVIELYRKLGVTRTTFYKHFKSICEKLAFSLGGYYTDEGYITYLTTQYGLTSEQVELLRTYISGRFRHKMKRTNK